MITMRSLPLSALASALLISAFVPAGIHGQGVVAAARIVNRIDESQLVTLKGNTHPFANAKNDRGKVADNLPMTDMILVLSRSPRQQAAFDAYVAGEYDQNSPDYHKWLTPDQIGEDFGPSQTDILTITNWLTGHGFTVSQVTRDRMSIRFSGTAAQVETTFHTEIHNLEVHGKMHIGNMSDPEIPAALSPVVVGVKSLHNFFPRPLHRMGQTVQRDAATGKWVRPAVAAKSPLSASQPSPNPLFGAAGARPQFGIQGSADGYPYLEEDVAPWDFAAIYNVTPLWNAGIDGTGQTIAIAGTSAIDICSNGNSYCSIAGANGNNDVATFRTFFDLPTNNAWNTPILVSGNTQPLQVCTSTSIDALCGIDDLVENSLDVEWSGSVAKNAQIVLVSSYPASETDDNLYDSESYIVDNVGNSSSPVYGVHVMNVSYGECELGLGTAGNVQYYNLWQTAAAEGLAVFVAAGDSGAASCDDGGDEQYGNPYAAQYGLSVSGLASTPYNTAVGGTDFNWCPLLTEANATSTSNECQPGPYWSATLLTPPGGSSPSYSALGYVPEVPWNDTCTSPLALPYLESFFEGTQYEASNGGMNSVGDAETACNAIVYYAEELYQQEYYAQLYLVDTVGGSGGASNCVVNSTNSSITSNTIGTCTAGATSTGSTSNPDSGAAQGSLTVVNNGWPKPSWQSGVTGIPNDSVRDIPDVSFFASDGFLSSSAYLICVSQDDTAYGGNQPCSYSSKQEPVAQEVGGTSVATPAMAGVMALINQKAGAAQGSPNSGLYALAAKQTYSSCSAESVSADSTSCYFNDIDQGTNAMPCVSNATDFYVYTGFPLAASPNCDVIHAGDYVGILSGYSAGVGYDEATGLGSLNVANVVNGWTATVGTGTATITITPATATPDLYDWLTVTVTVASASGPTPTGTVTLVASTGGGPALDTLTGTLSGAGTYTFNIPANTLMMGPDLLTVTYGGDPNYASASNSTTINVSDAILNTPTVSLTPATQTVNSEGAFTETVTVGGSQGAATGYVELTSGSYSSGWQALSGGSYQFTIGSAGTQLPLAAGTNTLTVNYSGGTAYSAGSATAQVTVASSTFTLTAGTVSPSSVTPGASATVNVTAAAVAGYSGTVTLSCAQTGGPTSGDGTTCNSTSSSQINLATCGSNCSVSFTIGTTAPSNTALIGSNLPGSNKKQWLGAGSGALLALLVFFGIPARRRSWRQMLAVLVALAAMGTMMSCGGVSQSGGTGGGGNGDPGTSAGTYTYTVTATANPSVTPVVTTTFTVNVN